MVSHLLIERLALGAEDLDRAAGMVPSFRQGAEEGVMRPPRGRTSANTFSLASKPITRCYALGRSNVAGALIWSSTTLALLRAECERKWQSGEASTRQGGIERFVVPRKARKALDQPEPRRCSSTDREDRFRAALAIAAGRPPG